MQQQPLRILAFDDDWEDRRAFFTFLQKQRFGGRSVEVVQAASLADFEKRIETWKQEIGTPRPDLVLLDVYNGAHDSGSETQVGFEMSQVVRSRPGWREIPIVVFSWKLEHELVHRSLNSGFSYVPKGLTPSALSALAAEIERAISLPVEDAIPVGALNIDARCFRISGPDYERVFGGKEWDLLLYLAKRSGEVISREQIEAHVDTESLKDVVARLRELLGPYQGYLKTIRGRGHVLEPN